MDLNVVHLVGRAGRDPEMRFFDSGKVLCKFSLAVNRPSSKTDQPDWFNLEIWGRTAEIAGDYVKKGSLIGVQGSLKIDQYTNRSGYEVSSPVIRVDRLDLLGSKRDNDPSTMSSYDDEF